MQEAQKRGTYKEPYPLNDKKTGKKFRQVSAARSRPRVQSCAPMPPRSYPRASSPSFDDVVA